MRDQFAALFARHTQESRLLRLTTTLGPEVLLAERVEGDEGISEGYAFKISALSLDAHIPLRSLLAQPALLELATAASGRRAFHGYLTGVYFNGADGGMARYTLTLQPWTAFLARGRDSRVFQGLNVFDILDIVFRAYAGKGTLLPAWRFDIADRSSYAVRSLVTQYQESDLAFVERLLFEEGLVYYFDHAGDAGSSGLGRHELVIADHNDAFKPNDQPVVRFAKSSTVMKEDSIDRWRHSTRARASAVEMSSWDYRAAASRVVGAGSGELINRDDPGTYAYASRDHGQDIAAQQLEAIEACVEIFKGEGTVRTLAAGTTFALHGHEGHDAQCAKDERLLITRVRHHMRNNLGADMQAAGLEVAVYRNELEAVPAGPRYRASRTDGHGQRLHPKPTVHGQQTAIVVGPAGAVVHTDRDHRIKVQFHWQRGVISHSRLVHPHPDGHTGAPGDDSAGTWVRVATSMAPTAGPNWGANAIPRVGQEVLVDFLDGDIDRPVVIGALYNGAGVKNSQYNAMGKGAGVSTANAAPWFPGTAGAHAHPPVLSGFKSQGMRTSQSGNAAFSQLVFDDSAEQPRVALQRHTVAHECADELNLGHLRHQVDNQRLGPVGFGAELQTQHSAALRAGKGMLLSADLRAGATGTQMDASEAEAQTIASRDVAQMLADSAQKHGAAAAKSNRAEGDTSLGRMQLSAPAGIVAVTPGDAGLAAGESGSVIAGGVNLAVQGNTGHAIHGGISMFTFGKGGADAGIKLHAASGTFSMQAQAATASLTADKAIVFASITKNVKVAASKHVLLTAQGAGIKLQGGNIELYGPGEIQFKASMKDLTGPRDGSRDEASLPKAKGIFNEAFVVLNELTGAPMANVPYRLESAGGLVLNGVTDAQGRVQRVFTASAEELKLYLTDNE